MNQRILPIIPQGATPINTPINAVEGAATRFEACRHVPNGGVLCALGALLQNGLLSPVREVLAPISGYDTAAHLLLGPRRKGPPVFRHR